MSQPIASRPDQFAVDAAACLSSGECVLAAPDVFELGPDGVARVRPNTPHLDDVSAATVVGNCPGKAIRLLGSGIHVT